MRKLVFVAVAVVVLLVGGGLTSMILVGGKVLIHPAIGHPRCIHPSAAPWQAEQLVLLVGFLLFNLIGMAATIAIVMWLLHRGVKQVRADGGTAAVTPAREGE